MTQLPDFPIEEDEQQQQAMHMIQMMMNGAVAPSNSLLAASIETLSYKANSMKQQAGGQAPSQEEFMRQLMQLAPRLQTCEEISVSKYSDCIAKASTAEAAGVAHTLSAMSLRQAAEAQFDKQMEPIRREYFKKALTLNKHAICEMLEQFGELSDAERQFAQLITCITTKYIPADLESLYDILLQGCNESILANQLSGFELAFEFCDQSALEIIVKFDISPQLADVKVKAITGAAAQLLAQVTKHRHNTLFGNMIPFTEAEMQAASAQSRAQMTAHLASSAELLHGLRTKLTMFV